MIPFPPAFVSLLVGVFSIALLAMWALGFGKKKTMPQSKPSMAENVKMLQLQKGLHKMMHVFNITRSFKEGDYGRSTHGVTFQFAFPTWNPFIITTEYELARLFLQGDSKNDIPEVEKSSYMKTLNTVDRNVNSILTHDTSDVGRDRTRKALAPSFSTTNLQQTWPYLQDGLVEEFGHLRKLAASGELLDCRNNILMFFLRMLGKSAFGIEFTDDGTEDDTNISGLDYLAVQHTAGSVRMKEMSMPFRRFFFWDKNVQDGQRACVRVKEIAEKMTRLYRQNEARAEAAGEPRPKRHSLMQHMMEHAYPSEIARVTDVNVMTFAGHDTTGFSFCFFLMEMARHPEAMKRVQAEIATVMPREPLQSTTETCTTSTTTGTAQQALHHGDQKLLSALCGLEYLNYCIKESMRLWPVASIGSVRQLDKDVHWKGMILPKGSSIRAHVFSMFREQWIDRPTEFLPERWAPENPQLTELKEMFIPFSLGKRACIGQNMAMFQLRIIAAYFLHNFDFTLVGEPDFEYFITLKPVDLYLSVRERTV